MNGVAVGGESDWDLRRICGEKVSDVVRNVVVVSQHKTIVNVSRKNEEANGVNVSSASSKTKTAIYRLW